MWFRGFEKIYEVRTYEEEFRSTLRLFCKYNIVKTDGCSKDKSIL